MLHVAVGVVRDAQNRVLIAQRANHQHQGGLWEFPGGKVESGEDVKQALSRELLEELGIHVESASPLITIPHHYADRSVLLDVWEVKRFHGNPQGREGQPIKWVLPDQLSHYSFPAANKPILRAIELPQCIALAGDFSSQQDFLQRLHRLPDMGVSALVLRFSSTDAWRHLDFAEIRGSAIDLGIELIVHTKSLPQQFNFLDVSGFHLDSTTLSSLSVRPANVKWLGASCHNLEQLERAQALGCDYAFLSPVNPTASHPSQEPLGWNGFASLVAEVAFPVYALGGVAPEHWELARIRGGQGVACLSACW